MRWDAVKSLFLMNYSWHCSWWNVLAVHVEWVTTVIYCSSEASMSTQNCQNYILNTEPFRTRVLLAISQGQKNKQIRGKTKQINLKNKMY